MIRSLKHRLERLESIIPEAQEEETTLLIIDARIDGCQNTDPAKLFMIENQRKTVYKLKSLPRLARRERLIHGGK